MSKIKYNASKTYLLPLLSELVNIDSNFINYLENTYMFDEDNEFFECFFLLFEFSFKNPEFTRYEHQLIDSELFVKIIDIKDSDRVVYVFKFPEDYLKEYYFLQESKYSKFGDDAKKLILKFWTVMYGKVYGGINVILTIKQKLYKDKILKEKLEKRANVKIDDDAELGQYVSKHDETFRIADVIAMKL